MEMTTTPNTEAVWMAEETTATVPLMDGRMIITSTPTGTETTFIRVDKIYKSKKVPNWKKRIQNDNH